MYSCTYCWWANLRTHYAFGQFVSPLNQIAIIILTSFFLSLKTNIVMKNTTKSHTRIGVNKKSPLFLQYSRYPFQFLQCRILSLGTAARYLCTLGNQSKFFHCHQWIIVPGYLPVCRKYSGILMHGLRVYIWDNLPMWRYCRSSPPSVFISTHWCLFFFYRSPSSQENNILVKISDAIETPLFLFIRLRISLCFVILMRITTTWLNSSVVVDGVSIHTFALSITQPLTQIVEFPTRFYNISSGTFFFTWFIFFISFGNSDHSVLSIIFRSDHLLDCSFLFIRSLSVTIMFRDFIKTFLGMVSLNFLLRIALVRAILGSKLA